MDARRDSWDQRGRVEKLVGQLAQLAADPSACQALGIDGILADQVDITFLEDPIDYIAYDLAMALQAAEEDEGMSPDVPPLLSTLVAEFRLCVAIRGTIDENEVVRRTLEHL